MVEKLSSYRVTAAMDATAYAAGMAQKVAADKAGAASAAQVGAAITATQTKVSQAGDVLTRLSRSYVDGFGQAERFARAVNTLGRGIETGNVPMQRAEAILDGIYRKYGMTANAADLLEQGHYQLATAVTAVNAKLGTENIALDLNSAAHQRNAAAMRMGAAQRTNLMFQLQDIGVSLAGGMNPLMVMMQQGSQISMIYGNGEGGLGRAFSETGKMAVGMVAKFWPVAAVLGALTLGTAALTTEINRNQKQQVGFGDVVVAMWELASQRILESLQPIIDWFGDMWDQVSPALAYGMNALIGTFDLAFRGVKSTWSMLPEAMGDFTIKTANNVIQAMEDMINGGLRLLNDFIVEANKLLPEGMKLGTIGDVDFGPGFANPFAGGEDRLLAQQQKDAAEVAALVESGGYTSMIGTKAREVANRPSDKEATKAADEAERQRKAYADLTMSSQQFIAQKQLEAQTLGMTTEAAARLRYEQEMLNKAANDNISLSPAQRAEIGELASAMAAAEERTRKLTEAYEFGKDTFSGFFTDLKADLMSGTSLWDGFANAGANALQKIADKALDMAVDGVWDMIFGAAAGAFGMGGFGGFKTAGGLNGTGGLSGSVKMFGSGSVFANGISGYSNQVINRPTVFPFAKGVGLMGEAGPEAVMPLSRGPDGRLGVRAANQNVSVVINIENNAGANVTAKQTGTDGAGRAIIEIAVNEAVQRVEGKMAKGKYSSMGVGPGLKRS